jgi:TIR domain
MTPDVNVLVAASRSDHPHHGPALTWLDAALDDCEKGRAAAFTYDVFLSHSSKDKTAVRAVAERLRADGLRVWFDEWEIRAGGHIQAKIEEGLEHSRVLVLCMSAQAFGSHWAQLESYTYRFRDPLNKERRFIPLRLDEAPIKGSLAQFLYINWLPEDREQEYAKLLEACGPPAKCSVICTVKG